MDIMVNEKTENGKAIEGLRIDLKESMKKNLYLIIGNALDEETRRATEEIMKERDNAVQQLTDETRALFKKILEEEKKLIWANELQSTISTVFNSGNGKATITQAPIQSTVNVTNLDTQNAGNNHQAGVSEEKVELEILPPRDQNEIAAINTYLINMPEIKKVELVTLIDKSIFKVIISQPVDFVTRLSFLPQVFNAEELIEKGQKQIRITLSAKAKLEQNHSEVNEKVSKIFKKKN
jgi:hypothetical protein